VKSGSFVSCIGRVNFALLAVIVFSRSGFAAQPNKHIQKDSPAHVESADLQAGDILLVPLNCYVCNVIEEETGVPYSHSVVVANTTDNAKERLVYEAWGSTKATPFLEIQARAQKNQKLFHLRPKEFVENRAPSESEIASVFNNEFSGLSFDDEYLWNNTDAQGRDTLYCAEFVVKFINRFLNNPQPPAAMTFKKQPEFWKKYYQQFNRSVPNGELGASPATLYFSSRFIRLGEINKQ